MSGDKTVHDYPYMKEALETWARRIGNWARPDAVSNKQTDANEIFVWESRHVISGNLEY